MDQDTQPSTAEMLEEELKYAPTEVWTREGVRSLKKPVSPSPIQVALMDAAPVLITGAVWAEMAMAAKVELAIAVGTPIEAVVHNPDVFAALPEHSRVWLSGWQMTVNSGSCWNTAGSIGRTADRLIDDGFLLMAKTATTGPYSGTVPGRDDITPGRPGSPSFVRRMMGEAYLAWISAIE